MRTPISFVRCSTRYDNTLNRPDNVSDERQPTENGGQPEGDLQQIRLHPGHASCIVMT